MASKKGFANVGSNKAIGKKSIAALKSANRANVKSKKSLNSAITRNYGKGKKA